MHSKTYDFPQIWRDQHPALQIPTIWCELQYYRVPGLWLITTTWLLEVDAKLVIGIVITLCGVCLYWYPHLFGGILMIWLIWWFMALFVAGRVRVITVLFHRIYIFGKEPYSPWCLSHRCPGAHLFRCCEPFFCFPEIWPIEMTWNLATWVAKPDGTKVQSYPCRWIASMPSRFEQHGVITKAWRLGAFLIFTLMMFFWTSDWDFGGSWNVMDPISFSVQSF